MEWTSLCALVLLLVPGGASVEKEGEICRAWTSETESFFRTFQCPGRPDNAGATFCCGSCSSPYCCPSREERLDQEKCVNYGQPEDRRTVQDEWELQPRVGETADSMEFLPYVYFGVVVSCLIGCCCCCQCRNEELEMESMCPPRGFCTPVTPPVRCVDATSRSVEESCESLMSPSALENTPVVQFGGTNPEYHEDEAINVCSALHVHTTGCGPTLETGTNGEVPEQPWPGMDGDELEQPKNDLEHQLPRVVGKESEELRPGLNGGDLEQPGPMAVGEDLEEPRPSLDGEDLEQPGPKAVGEDLEEPRPVLDGEDSEQPWDNLEQPGHRAEGEDSEQLGPRADEEDSEMPRSDLGVEDLEHPWGNSQQLRPRVDEECSEELRSGMDGDESEQLQDDLEQPEPRVFGEVLEEPRPGMDGEDPEQLRPGTNGKDLEQLVPRADVKDLEEPKHGMDGEDLEEPRPGIDGKDVEQEAPNADGEDLEM